MTERSRIENIEQDIRGIWQKLRGIPSRFAGGGSVTLIPTIYNIEGGQTIETVGPYTFTGIKYNSGSAISTLPQASPSGYTLSLLPDNLGRGILASTSALVWVALRVDIGSGVIQGLIDHLDNGQLILSSTVIQVPYTGGGGATSPVYIPFAA